MEEVNLIESHRHRADRTVIRTIGILAIVSIPMLSFLKTVPLSARLLSMGLGIALWTALYLCFNITRTKPYTRFASVFVLNFFALMLMFALGDENTAIPYFFYIIIAVSMIYLDGAVVLWTAGVTVVFLGFFFFAYTDVMLASYRPRTLAYIIVLYLVFVPVFYMAARRAQRLLLDIQDRESQQKRLNATLSRVLGEAARISESLKGTGEILSSNVGELQASAQEAAAGMEEMARMADAQAGEVARVTDNVSTISTLAASIVRQSQELSASFQDTTTSAKQGAQLVSVIRESMHQVDSTMGGLSNAARRLRESSQKIGEILTFLGGLTQQTNLLSLNATIEAARAGEAGKGFSVVADEIRKLAELSSRGANQIDEIVSVALQEADYVVSAIQASNEIVETGVRGVDRAGIDFEQIVDSIEKASRRVADIDAALHELVTQNNSIMDAANSLASLAQQTAAGTEEVSSAVQQQASDLFSVSNEARKLNQTAAVMQGTVQEFGRINN